MVEGHLQRVKLQQYFLERSRLVAPPAGESNFTIFHLLLAALTPEEREQCELTWLEDTDLSCLAKYPGNKQVGKVSSIMTGFIFI